MYAFSPDLVLAHYAQYDTESRDVGLNTRLRWTIIPGNDLFLVWNHNLHRPEDPGDWSRLSSLDDHLVTKIRWTLRW